MGEGGNVRQNAAGGGFRKWLMGKGLWGICWWIVAVLGWEAVGSRRRERRVGRVGGAHRRGNFTG